MTKKQLSNEIDRIFGEVVGATPIPMMAMVDIYAVARRAHAEGRDMRAAMSAFLATVEVQL